MKKFLLLLTVSILTWSGLLATTPTMLRNVDQKACNHWVDSVMAAMSLRQKIAQLMVPHLPPNQGESTKAALRKFVQTYEVGGFLFSSGTLEEYVEMTNYAQAISKVPLLNTFDGEWGLAMRIADTPKFPQNMCLGAITDKQLLYDYGKEVARECRLAGIQVNFAPVADVNSNPSNPVIGMRSFGEDASRVATLVTAYAQGLEAGGVLSVAKHFPGHGDTDADSHKTLPVVNHSKDYLQNVDLKPFQTYIDAGCSGVMVGHLSVPSLDASGIPTSMSSKVVTDLLRKKMKFNGLVVTDGLSMKGAALPGKNVTLTALQAGADLLLSVSNPSADLDAIVNAINDGKLSKKVVEMRCRRVLTYKYILGLSKRKPIIFSGLSATLNSSQADNINRKLANAAVTVIRNENELLPLRHLENHSIALVNIGKNADESDDMEVMMKRYANVTVYNEHGSGLSSSKLKEVLSHDVVIAAVFSDKQWARNAVAQLGAAKNFAAVFMINPYHASYFKSELADADAIVFAYDDTHFTREAVAQAVFGGIEVSGKLPVNLKGFAAIGTGLKLHKTRLGFASPEAVGLRGTLTDSIDSLIYAGIKAGAFPGCQILVARKGEIVVDKCYGKKAMDGGGDVTPFTLYDLASVSKAIGTLPGVMKAYDKKLIDVDAPASRYIPGMLLDSAKSKITMRQLLYHESGMPASLDMYGLMLDTASYSGKLFSNTRDAEHTVKVQNKVYGNKSAKLRRDITSHSADDVFNIEAAKGIHVSHATYDTIMHTIYTIPLRKNNSYNYSCLNFCLLMDAEQRVTGKSHDEWMRTNFWKPLGAYTMCYQPLNEHKKTEIAPTENDTFLRKQTVHGYVHDELAAFSGGLQGNAGLFSNADDVAKICQMWLNGGVYGGDRILSQKTVDLFTKSKSPTCRRGLGFDKPDVSNPKSSPTCEEASPETYGHLGFTGTVFWVDPKEQLIFVFLNNRVNPTRDNAAFSSLNLRPKLFSQVYKSIIK